LKRRKRNLKRLVADPSLEQAHAFGFDQESLKVAYKQGFGDRETVSFLSFHKIYASGKSCAK
jgi:hypothetical protein